MRLPFGFREGDGLLNEHGVCTTYNEVETIDFMAGWKQRQDHARLEIVATPDGHYLIGIDVMFGNGGWGFAPSISGIGYDSREEAIREAVKEILASTYIDSDRCREIIADGRDRILGKVEQLELF